MSSPSSPSPSAFRAYLPEEGDPRVAAIRGLDAYQYREWAKQDPFPRALIEGWRPMYPAPFAGVTNDGTVRTGLYELADVPDDEAAPTAAMVAAAEALLAVLDDGERARLCYPVDADEWQSWANPEFMQHDTGLRLEFAREPVRQRFLDLVTASLSPEGADVIRTLMRVNGFLGDVLGLPGVMNEFSYNAAIYGMPDAVRPWGWQLFGHHVAINVAVVGPQMVLTPVFFGGEPTSIDEGPDAGATVFGRRIQLARELMGSLPDEMREQARTYRDMVDPAMPAGRIHPGDERHLAGAFQDNRVIPYEGVRVAEASAESQALVMAIVADFVAYAPVGVAARRQREVAEHLDETWFSWIGGYGDDDPFYFRIQSPVIVLELDHHTGVFLTNEHPAGFHVHTVMRTPNGNDYAKALIAQTAAVPTTA